MIQFRLNKKRYQGESKSGKAHVFTMSSSGGKFYSIPKAAIITFEEYTKKINEKHEEQWIKIKFENWAIKGAMGVKLSHALDNEERKNKNNVQR